MLPLEAPHTHVDGAEDDVRHATRTSAPPAKAMCSWVGVVEFEGAEAGAGARGEEAAAAASDAAAATAKIAFIL
jgi:hypothetical protein